MSPPDNGGTGGPPEGAEPAPHGIRLRKSLGAAGILIGSGLVVVMPFLDNLQGVRISGALSAQDIGILAGFAILLTGVALYLGSVISHMEHRHRGLEMRIENLMGASVIEPEAAPDGPAEKVAAAPKLPAAQEEPDVIPTQKAPGPDEPLPSAQEVAGAAAGTVPPVEEQMEAGMAAAPAAKIAPAEAAGVASGPATDCPVCGNELTSGVCRHCITSAAIQSAYQQLSRTQELGASVEEAAGLLGNARDSLEEKDYLQAGEYVRSARYLLEISAKTYFALRSAVEKAESERRKLEDSGLDTTELSSKLSAVRSAIVQGEYQEAKKLLDEERSSASDLQLPYFQRPASVAAVGLAGTGQAQPRPKATKQPQRTTEPSVAPRNAPPNMLSVDVKQGPPAAPDTSRPEVSEPGPSPDTGKGAAPKEPPRAQDASARIPATPPREVLAPKESIPSGEASTAVPESMSPQEPAPEAPAPVPTGAATEASTAPAPATTPALEPPAPSQKAVPKFSSGITSCPKCGRKTMKGWKKCPHCLTVLD